MIIAGIFSYGHIDAGLTFVIIQHGRFQIGKNFRIRADFCQLFYIDKVFTG